MDIEPIYAPPSGNDPIAVLIGGAVALQRSRCATDALEAAVFAGIVEASGAFETRGDETELTLRTVAAELGAAVHVNDHAMKTRLLEAHQLVAQFPDVHLALASAEITKAHARVIVDAGIVLAEHDRPDFVRRALELARVESPNRLRPMLAAVAEASHAVGIAERHREARKARCAWVTDDADGMSTLHAHLPSFLAHGILDRVDNLARTVRGAAATVVASGATLSRNATPSSGTTHSSGETLRGGEHLSDRGALFCLDAPSNPGASSAPTNAAGVDAGSSPLRDARTLAQTRADVLADLLTTGTPTVAPDGAADIRGHVSVTVPVLTLAGLTEAGAVVNGACPVDPDTARMLAGAAAGWDRVLTHPVTGAVLAVDRYTPTAELKRTLRVRDQHCRFPGCRMPARRSDIDHSTAYADGGATSADNLAHLCRHHHTVKHSAGWHIRHHGAGVLEFTSPQGRRYIDIPPPIAVAFRASDGSRNAGRTIESSDPPSRRVQTLASDAPF